MAEGDNFSAVWCGLAVWHNRNWAQLHQLDLLGTIAKSIAAGAEQKSCRASRWLTGLELVFVKVWGWSCLWSVGKGAETEDGKILL